MSQFSEIHPGGLAALLDPEVAGKDATAAFFGLHRQEVLYTPRYAKYKIGQVEGQEQKVMRNESGSISTVPYAEPMWLSTGYKQSPYFKESHFAVQKAMRKFIDEHVYPDAQACEESGKRMSQKILDMMGENGLHAMRQGPGAHLKGRKLFDGAVKPEEFDYFHEMIINQELSRLQARGYADGESKIGPGSRIEPKATLRTNERTLTWEMLGLSVSGFQAGTVIGLPPIINFARPEVKKKIVEDAFAGKVVSHRLLASWHHFMCFGRLNVFAVDCDHLMVLLCGTRVLTVTERQSGGH
jgi:hypothetical protein